MLVIACILAFLIVVVIGMLLDGAWSSDRDKWLPVFSFMSVPVAVLVVVLIIYTWSDK